MGRQNGFLAAVSLYLQTCHCSIAVLRQLTWRTPRLALNAAIRLPGQKMPNRSSLPSMVAELSVDVDVHTSS
jgi:hypothetical protein